jgi:hypothetical protein
MSINLNFLDNFLNRQNKARWRNGRFNDRKKTQDKSCGTRKGRIDRKIKQNQNGSASGKIETETSKIEIGGDNGYN